MPSIPILEDGSVGRPFVGRANCTVADTDTTVYTASDSDQSTTNRTCYVDGFVIHHRGSAATTVSIYDGAAGDLIFTVTVAATANLLIPNLEGMPFVRGAIVAQTSSVTTSGTSVTAYGREI